MSLVHIPLRKIKTSTILGEEKPSDFAFIFLLGR